MGSLNLPESGAVYFDTNAFIYSLEKIEPFCSALAAAWDSAREGAIEVVSSELAFLEALIQPLRARDTVAERLYRALFFESKEVRLVPISVPILEHAAHIRAETGIRTPDAIHAATALERGAGMFVTNDSQFVRVPELPVSLLSDA